LHNTAVVQVKMHSICRGYSKTYLGIKYASSHELISESTAFVLNSKY